MDRRCAKLPSVERHRLPATLNGARLASDSRLHDGVGADADADRSTNRKRQLAKYASPSRSVRRLVHHAHPIVRLEVVLTAFADEEERGFASLGPVRLGRQEGVLPDSGPSDTGRE